MITLFICLAAGLIIGEWVLDNPERIGRYSARFYSWLKND